MAGQRVSVTAMVMTSATAHDTPIVWIRFSGRNRSPRKHIVSVEPLATIMVPLERRTLATASCSLGSDSCG